MEHRDRIKISKKKGYDQPVLLPADYLRTI